MKKSSKLTSTKLFVMMKTYLAKDVHKQVHIAYKRVLERELTNKKECVMILVSIKGNLESKTKEY